MKGKNTGQVIAVEKVWKIYKMGEVEFAALKGVSLEIKKGDFVALTGSSGSGKSTMMNLIGCLDTPTKGKVLLVNEDISEMSESDLAQARGKKIGFVFQQFNLIPTLSAIENVMLPMQFQEVDEEESILRATKLLESVGLDDRLNHLPSQLSGGQQQRVAIARALSNDPDLILADEPTGNLDSTTGQEVISLLGRLCKDDGKTIVIITHDPKIAGQAKRIVELKDGQIHLGGNQK